MLPYASLEWTGCGPHVPVTPRALSPEGGGEEKDICVNKPPDCRPLVTTPTPLILFIKKASVLPLLMDEDLNKIWPLE